MSFFQNAGVDVNPSAVSQGIFDISSDQKAAIGYRMQLTDGRVFHYAKAGGSALVAGHLLSSPAHGGTTTEQVNMTVSTASTVGGNTIGLTAVTDSFTANQFQGGYLGIYSGTAAQGGGQTYRIKSHTAASAGGTFTVTIYDSFKVAVSTSATATIVKHPWDGVVDWPTTFTGVPAGVPLVAVTASYYFWMQTWGLASVLVDSGAALTLGADVLASNAVAGSVEADDAAKAQPHIGYAISAGAASKFQLVFLRIAP